MLVVSLVHGRFELLPFLFLTWAQPLLIVVNIWHGYSVPGDEVEINEQVETEAGNPVSPADEEAATTANWLVHWLTKEKDKKDDAQKGYDDDSEKETRQEDGDGTRIELPLAPFL